MIEFNGDWLVRTETSMRLNDAGYMVGTFMDKDVRKYTLHNRSLAHGPEKIRWPVVFETTDLQELNNMVKLLIQPTEG